MGETRSHAISLFMKEIKLRTILNSRTGMKYFAGPDLITYFHGMKNDRPREVQDFIEEVVVALATSQNDGTYHPIA